MGIRCRALLLFGWLVPAGGYALFFVMGLILDVAPGSTAGNGGIDVCKLMDGLIGNVDLALAYYFRLSQFAQCDA